MHNAADDPTIVRPLDAPNIRRQARFDPLPLLIAQPKQVSAHDPNPLPKTNQDRIVRAEKLMSSDPSTATEAWLSVPRSQRHDDVCHCGLVHLESGPAVVGPTAKIYDLGALGCRAGGLDRLHDVEPVLVKKERVFAEQLVEFCNDGSVVRNNARFQLA